MLLRGSALEAFADFRFEKTFCFFAEVARTGAQKAAGVAITVYGYENSLVIPAPNYDFFFLVQLTVRAMLLVVTISE